MTTAEVSRPLGVATVVVAAGAEVITALVLIIRPALFGRLLFGAEFSPPRAGAGSARRVRSAGAGSGVLAAVGRWTEIRDRSTGHLQPLFYVHYF